MATTYRAQVAQLKRENKDCVVRIHELIGHNRKLGDLLKLSEQESISKLKAEHLATMTNMDIEIRANKQCLKFMKELVLDLVNNS